jgi:hypothetical protein
MQVYGDNGVTIRKGVLNGFEKEGLNIIEKEGSHVEGGIIELNEKELKSVDTYEGLGYLYKKIKVNSKGEKVMAYQLI